MTDPTDRSPRRPARSSRGLPPELDPRADQPRSAESQGRTPRPDRLPDDASERFRRVGYTGRSPNSQSSQRPDGQRGQGGGPRRPGGPPPRTGGPGGRGGRPDGRRPLAHWLKILGAVAAVVVLVISGAMWNFYRSFNTKITHIDAVPAGAATGPGQNILLVGNDSRAGLSAAELKEVATQAEAGLNTDTMLLVHIPADGRQATAVSMPRDSYVNIPGVGMEKLNAAYANGACANGCGAHLTTAQKEAGARKLVETVEQLSGQHIDHYVEVGLLGFYDITNVLGGVTICLKEPAKDHYSGIDLPAGVQTIKGTQALAFVRQRHGLPGGDLDRVRRQQAFLSAVADKVLTADTLLKPWKLKPLLDAVAKSLTVDKSFDPVAEVEKLRELAAGNVKFETMPVGTGTMINGKDVLPVDTAKVRAFFAAIDQDKGSGRKAAGGGGASPAAPKVPRSHITVQVLNGGTVKGLAAKTNKALQQAGFQTTTPGNAPGGNYPKPEILYTAGQADAAKTLAAVVPGAVLKEDDTLGTTLHLIVGDNFGGIHAASFTVPAATGGHGMVAGGQPAPLTMAAAGSSSSSGPACVN